MLVTSTNKRRGRERALPALCDALKWKKGNAGYNLGRAESSSCFVGKGDPVSKQSWGKWAASPTSCAALGHGEQGIRDDVTIEYLGSPGIHLCGDVVGSKRGQIFPLAG